MSGQALNLAERYLVRQWTVNPPIWNLCLLKMPFLLPALMLRPSVDRFSPMISVLVSLLLTPRARVSARVPRLHLSAWRKDVRTRGRSLKGNETAIAVSSTKPVRSRRRSARAAFLRRERMALEATMIAATRDGSRTLPSARCLYPRSRLELHARTGYPRPVAGVRPARGGIEVPCGTSRHSATPGANNHS